MCEAKRVDALTLEVEFSTEPVALQQLQQLPEVMHGTWLGAEGLKMSHFQ